MLFNFKLKLKFEKNHRFIGKDSPISASFMGCCISRSLWNCRFLANLKLAGDNLVRNHLVSIGTVLEEISSLLSAFFNVRSFLLPCAVAIRHNRLDEKILYCFYCNIFYSIYLQIKLFFSVFVTYLPNMSDRNLCKSLEIQKEYINTKCIHKFAI